MNRKKDTQTNYFDGLPTAYYDAVFRDSKFYDAHSGKEITLKEGARVRIQTLRPKVLDEDYEGHLERRREKLIGAGEKLQFRIGLHDFTVRILEDLYLTKEGNRFSKLGACHCEVVDVDSSHDAFNFHPLEAETLNQAYTQTSIRYFPEKRSHNCNVFKTMRYGGEILELLGEF